MAYKPLNSAVVSNGLVTIAFKAMSDISKLPLNVVYCVNILIRAGGLATTLLMFNSTTAVFSWVNAVDNVPPNSTRGLLPIGGFTNTIVANTPLSWYGITPPAVATSAEYAALSFGPEIGVLGTRVVEGKSLTLLNQQASAINIAYSTATASEQVFYQPTDMAYAGFYADYSRAARTIVPNAMQLMFDNKDTAANTVMCTPPLCDWTWLHNLYPAQMGAMGVMPVQPDSRSPISGQSSRSANGCVCDITNTACCLYETAAAPTTITPLPAGTVVLGQKFLYDTQQPCTLSTATQQYLQSLDPTVTHTNQYPLYVSMAPLAAAINLTAWSGLYNSAPLGYSPLSVAMRMAYETQQYFINNPVVGNIATIVSLSPGAAPFTNSQQLTNGANPTSSGPIAVRISPQLPQPPINNCGMVNYVNYQTPQPVASNQYGVSLGPIEPYDYCAMSYILPSIFSLEVNPLPLFKATTIGWTTIVADDSGIYAGQTIAAWKRIPTLTWMNDLPLTSSTSIFPARSNTYTLITSTPGATSTHKAVPIWAPKGGRRLQPASWLMQPGTVSTGGVVTSSFTYTSAGPSNASASPPYFYTGILNGVDQSTSGLRLQYSYTVGTNFTVTDPNSLFFRGIPIQKQIGVIVDNAASGNAGGWLVSPQLATAPLTVNITTTYATPYAGVNIQYFFVIVANMYSLDQNAVLPMANLVAPTPAGGTAFNQTLTIDLSTAAYNTWECVFIGVGVYVPTDTTNEGITTTNFTGTLSVNMLTPNVTPLPLATTNIANTRTALEYFYPAFSKTSYIAGTPGPPQTTGLWPGTPGVAVALPGPVATMVPLAASITSAANNIIALNGTATTMSTIRQRNQIMVMEHAGYYSALASNSTGPVQGSSSYFWDAGVGSQLLGIGLYTQFAIAIPTAHIESTLTTYFSDSPLVVPCSQRPNNLSITTSRNGIQDYTNNSFGVVGVARDAALNPTAYANTPLNAMSALWDFEAITMGNAAGVSRSYAVSTSGPYSDKIFVKAYPTLNQTLYPFIPKTETGQIPMRQAFTNDLVTSTSLNMTARYNAFTGGNPSYDLTPFGAAIPHMSTGLNIFKQANNGVAVPFNATTSLQAVTSHPPNVLFIDADDTNPQAFLTTPTPANVMSPLGLVPTIYNVTADPTVDAVLPPLAWNQPTLTATRWLRYGLTPPIPGGLTRQIYISPACFELSTETATNTPLLDSNAVTVTFVQPDPAVIQFTGSFMMNNVSSRNNFYYPIVRNTQGYSTAAGTAALSFAFYINSVQIPSKYIQNYELHVHLTEHNDEITKRVDGKRGEYDTPLRF